MTRKLGTPLAVYTRFLLLLVVALAPAAALAQEDADRASLSDSVRGGFGRVTGMFRGSSNKTVAELDPEISLKSDTRPSSRSYVALARLLEERKSLDLAAQKYRQAIELDPDDADAHLAFAQFLDRQNKLDAALAEYDKALAIRPNDSVILNHLGLCLARHLRLEDSVRTLQRAITLQPQNVLYRNNISIVLVKMGRIDLALEHLMAVHSRSVAYYNVAHSLCQNGQSEAAILYFESALREEPGFVHARVWLNSLRPQSEQMADGAAPRQELRSSNPHSAIQVGEPMATPTSPAIGVRPLPSIGSMRGQAGNPTLSHSPFRRPR